jgi:NAD(P)H-dependent FMN reductase
MKKILGFSGSMSADSINHKLVSYAADQIKEFELNVIQLSDFEAPLYAKEREAENGIPESIQRLRTLFDDADGFIISIPEYNSSLPAGFKNTMDWLSRMEGKIFQNKPVLLMATSPGGRGGKSVLDHLSVIIPFWGAQLIGPFSLPVFKENFGESSLNEPFDSELKSRIKELESAISVDADS